MITQRRRFKDLDEQHILALAISSEEDDARIYRGFAARLRNDFPKTAALFDDMAKEEDNPPRTCGRVLQPSTNVVVGYPEP